MPKDSKTDIFCPLSKKNYLGIYDSEIDTVCINSNYNEFTNLISQNNLEESQGNYHPITKHFLQTYIHEFSHAAHFKNIYSKYGINRGNEIINNDLCRYSPDEIIIGPLNALIKSKLPKFCDKIIDTIIPPNNGRYSATNLIEYFAEKNSKHIAEMLGDNYCPSMVKNIASEYQTHPYNWDVLDEFKKILIPPNKSIFEMLEKGTDFHDTIKIIYDSIKLFNQDIQYTDGDIFH